MMRRWRRNGLRLCLSKWPSPSGPWPLISSRLTSLWTPAQVEGLQLTGLGGLLQLTAKRLRGPLWRAKSPITSAMADQTHAPRPRPRRGTRLGAELGGGFRVIVPVKWQHDNHTFPSREAGSAELRNAPVDMGARLPSFSAPSAAKPVCR